MIVHHLKPKWYFHTAHQTGVVLLQDDNCWWCASWRQCKASYAYRARPHNHAASAATALCVWCIQIISLTRLPTNLHGFNNVPITWLWWHLLKWLYGSIWMAWHCKPKEMTAHFTDFMLHAACRSWHCKLIENRMLTLHVVYRMTDNLPRSIYAFCA